MFKIVFVFCIVATIAHAEKVVFGGSFEDAGGLPNTKCLATWDPCSKTWSQTMPKNGFGLACYVYAVAMAPDNTLYVGGGFHDVSGAKVNNILSLSEDGVIGDLDGGVDSTVKAIYIDWQNKTDRSDYTVYFGGYFSQSKHSSPIQLGYIAKYSPKTKKLSALCDKSNNCGVPNAVASSGWRIETLAKDGEYLLIGGMFMTSTVLTSDRWGYIYNPAHNWTTLPIEGAKTWLPNTGSVSLRKIIPVSSTSNSTTEPQFYLGGTMTSPVYKIGLWNQAAFEDIGPNLFSSSKVHSFARCKMPDGKMGTVAAGEYLLSNFGYEVAAFLSPSIGSWRNVLNFKSGMMMPRAYSIDCEPTNGTLYFGGEYMETAMTDFKYYGNAAVAYRNGTSGYRTEPLGLGIRGTVYAVNVVDKGPCRPVCKTVTNCSVCIDSRWASYCVWCAASGKCLDALDTTLVASCPTIKSGGSDKCADIGGSVLGGIVVAVVVIAAGLGGATAGATGFLGAAGGATGGTAGGSAGGAAGGGTSGAGGGTGGTAGGSGGTSGTGGTGTGGTSSGGIGSSNPLDTLFALIDYLQFMVITSAMSATYPDLYSSFIGLFSFLSFTIDLGWINTNFPIVDGLSSYSGSINVEPRHLFLTNFVILALLLGVVILLFGSVRSVGKWQLHRIVQKKKIKTKEPEDGIVQNEYDDEDEKVKARSPAFERWDKFTSVVTTLMMVFVFRILLLAYYNVSLTSAFQLSSTDWNGPAGLGAVFLLSLIVFIVYVVGFPVVVLLTLIRHKPVDAFSDRMFLVRFGCFFKDLTESSYLFKLVEIGRKFIQAAAVGFLFRNALAQYIIITVMQLLYCVALWKFGIYRDGVLRKLKLMNGISGLCNLFLLIAFIPSVSSPPLAMIIIAALCVALQFVTIACNLMIYAWPILKRGFLLPIAAAYHFIHGRAEKRKMERVQSTVAPPGDVELQDQVGESGSDVGEGEGKDGDGEGEGKGKGGEVVDAEDVDVGLEDGGEQLDAVKETVEEKVEEDEKKVVEEEKEKAEEVEEKEK